MESHIFVNSVISSSKLKQHMVLHGEEKPHVGSEIKFRHTKKNLKKHMPVHTGEKLHNVN